MITTRAPDGANKRQSCTNVLLYPFIPPFPWCEQHALLTEEPPDPKGCVGGDKQHWTDYILPNGLDFQVADARKVENLDINPSYIFGNCCFTLFLHDWWFKGNLCCCIRPVHWGKGWNIRLQLRQFTKEAKAEKPEINDKPTSFRIAMMFTAEVVAGAWFSYLEDGFYIFLTLMIVMGMIMFAYGGDRENWPNYQYTCLAIYTMTLPLKGAQGKHTWRLVPSFLIPFLHSIHWDFAT